MTGLRRRLISLTLLCSVAACSHEHRITLAAPAARVEAVSGSGQVSLDVVSQDRRPQFKDRVGTLRSSNLRVIAENDVADVVRGGVEQGLKDEGFAIAASGLILTIELTNFYCDYNLGATANVSFTLRARTRDGLTLYSHSYEGAGHRGSAFSTSVDHNVKAALEDAVGMAVNQVMLDKALQRALLRSSGGTPARRS